MLLAESSTRTVLHVRADTPPPVYVWDGKPANHPLRKLRDGLGKDKAMRLAKEAKVDRLDINALEKGKNKGNGAELVLRLAIPLFLTPQEMFDLLHFQLDPEEALKRAQVRQLEGVWDQLMAGVRPHEIQGKSQLSKERVVERQQARIRKSNRARKAGKLQTRPKPAHEDATGTQPTTGARRAAS
jgi:hypothetical protein